MNVIVYDGGGKVEKVYVNPKMEFDFYMGRQVLLMHLNGVGYSIACHKETLFSFEEHKWDKSFNLLPTEDGYVIDVDTGFDVRVKDFSGWNEEMWKKEGRS